MKDNNLIFEEVPEQDKNENKNKNSLFSRKAVLLILSSVLAILVSSFGFIGKNAFDTFKIVRQNEMKTKQNELTIKKWEPEIEKLKHNDILFLQIQQNMTEYIKDTKIDQDEITKRLRELEIEQARHFGK